MNARVDVSIAIASRNGARSVSRAVEAALASADASGLQCELLLVDNGSTDATSAIFAEVARERPSTARVLSEPVPGLSRARNCAVSSAAGSVVAFTDDDVLVPTDWVRKLA